MAIVKEHPNVSAIDGHSTSDLRLRNLSILTQTSPPPLHTILPLTHPPPPLPTPNPLPPPLPRPLPPPFLLQSKFSRFFSRHTCRSSHVSRRPLIGSAGFHSGSSKWRKSRGALTIHRTASTRLAGPQRRRKLRCPHVVRQQIGSGHRAGHRTGHRTVSGPKQTQGGQSEPEVGII